MSHSPPTASKPLYKHLSSQQDKERKNMKFKTVTCITVMALLVALAMPISLAAQQIITFDAPGAGTTSTPGCLSNGSCQGTFPQQNIPVGIITGYYVDTNFMAHGFVRATDGTITT